MSKEKWKMRFSECEHEGDLENYASELRECGAVIADQRLDQYELERMYEKIQSESNWNRVFRRS